MTKPETGRTVHFFPSEHDTISQQSRQPLAAMVACVRSDGLVNLTVFDAIGNTHNRVGVVFVPPGMPNPGANYCTVPSERPADPASAPVAEPSPQPAPAPVPEAVPQPVPEAVVAAPEAFLAQDPPAPPA